MSYITNKAVLMDIFNCGSLDLEMLEDIGYDMCHILEEFRDIGGRNFNDFLSSVFSLGLYDLQAAVEDKRDDVEQSDTGVTISELQGCGLYLEDIHDALTMVTEGCPQNGIAPLADFNVDDLENIIFNWVLLDEFENLQPDDDVSWFVNYLDTHIYLKNYDIYMKYLKEEIEEIERKMGFDFYSA